MQQAFHSIAVKKVAHFNLTVLLTFNYRLLNTVTTINTLLFL